MENTTKNKELTKEEILHEVRYNGMTDRELYDKRLILKVSTRAYQLARNDYLNSRQLPKTRKNIYVTGGAGRGKSVAARILAKNLFPEIKKEKDLYFYAGMYGADLIGYDGQPIIIWDNVFADEVPQHKTSKTRLFDALSHIPNDTLQKARYEKVKLLHSYNIICSAQPIERFMDALQKNATSLEVVDKIINVKLHLKDNHYEISLNDKLYHDKPLETAYPISFFEVGRTAQNTDKNSLQYHSLVIKPVVEALKKPVK